jgi:hypothetical protein
MSLGIKFVYGSRFQLFDVRVMDGGLSFARRSSKSIREVWFSLHTSAMVTTQGEFRSATEHIGFTMGNTFQRIKQVAPPLYDFVYDYEAEMADLHGDGVYTDAPYLRSEDAPF